jgi:hypothetical protein
VYCHLSAELQLQPASMEGEVLLPTYEVQVHVLMHTCKPAAQHTRLHRAVQLDTVLAEHSQSASQPARLAASGIQHQLV